VDIFKDTEGIKTGDDWQDVLNSNLDSARIFLFLLSVQWLQSKWCNLEYKIFTERMKVDQMKKLFPVEWVAVDDRFLNDDQKLLNKEIRKEQLFDFKHLQNRQFESAEVNSAIVDLADRITEYLGSIRAP
jgi:hypothetical protein